jgi:ArsR family transcriptional regulator, arsenate/arsenite/antimonite-responsive transcriptional repressor
MKTLVRIAKALSDKNRVRIIAALAKGELCVCQIVELLNLAHSTTSKHLSILSQSGLTDSRKDGRWIYYRLLKADNSLASKVITLFLTELKQDDLIVQDKRRLQCIVRMDTEKLCSLQKQKRKAE